MQFLSLIFHAIYVIFYEKEAFSLSVWKKRCTFVGNMKTGLILVGKTTERHFQTGIDDYCQRLVHYMPFDVIVVPELKNSRSLSEDQQRAKEGEAILRVVQPGDVLVLLDEHGKEMRSVEFATWIEKRRQSSKRLLFCIGGPYGFSPAVYERADEKISLSKMTFSHQMVRMVFVEQLYRACTIINGEKYHHE